MLIFCVFTQALQSSKTMRDLQKEKALSLKMKMASAMSLVLLTLLDPRGSSDASSEKIRFPGEIPGRGTMLVHVEVSLEIAMTCGRAAIMPNA